MKAYKKLAAALSVTAFLIVQGCKPYEEEGIDLPGAPSASINWNFIDAVDSLGRSSESIQIGFLFLLLR